MFSLRLLVFALILHNAAAEKEEQDLDDSSLQKDSKKCGNETVTISNRGGQGYIYGFLEKASKNSFYQNESKLDDKIKELECIMDFWGISSEDFSYAIKHFKIRKLKELKDWQLKFFDKAGERYKNRHLIATEPSVTSSTTTTVSRITESTTGATESKVDTTTSTNTTTASTMEPISTTNTTTAPILEISTSIDTATTSTEEPTTITDTTTKAAHTTTTLAPASNRTKVVVVPKALLDETDDPIPKESFAEPEAKETGVGKIILYSALGILVLIVLAIGAIALYHRHSNRRTARIRQKIKGSGICAGAALAHKLSGEQIPLKASTPMAPTPKTRTEPTPRPVRSATSLLTSPSAADATLSVPRAHSSAGASERVCEIGRRKSSPSHTQITQSISASQDSPQ